MCESMVSVVFPDVDFTFPHTYFHVKPQQMDIFSALDQDTLPTYAV